MTPTGGSAPASALAPTAAARVRPWPNEPTIGHLVLLDFAMVPTGAQVASWTADAFAANPQYERLRTSVLLPDAATVFAAEGYVDADRLVLLEREIPRSPALPKPAGPAVLGRLTARKLGTAAELDRRAFPPEWRNDERSLADVSGATPQHHNRLASIGGRPVGFAISGRSKHVGYLQRFAVDPSARRAGIGRQLVDDALRWLQRRGATTALVNTGIDNTAGLALYRHAGFTARPDLVVVMERRR